MTTADLIPQIGTEPRMIWSVVAIQTNLLNKIPHPSTIVCPITTNVQAKAEILRVHLNKGVANLNQPCDIMIDQIRTIDNKRLTRKIGTLPDELIEKVMENIRIVLALE
ncbi:type II toxin-antitoxin system PemK/MazF family toxin [Cyclobacterium sp.]|uniref:type II toxin-antitoxin system PemK/MazF family toxin n=1 Tax=Cyclobacterium sp. TaxID=1966343 RepID=UPI0025BF1749|nr:type II toxin-antitoxin system PemK/MazF family toxin [Cyclobacterium sp.]